VGLNAHERIYGKKNLLYCQMSLLTATQKYQKYRKLRKEELTLKRLLKKTLLELTEATKKLDSNLPHFKEKIYRPENLNASKKAKKRNTLQDEINDIKRRIAELG